jgi:hypothetical protein
METRAAIPAAQFHGSPQNTSFQNTPLHNRTVIPLNAEREKAYIELARQYFYVFSTTPVVVPAVKPISSASVAGEEASVEAVSTKSKREEILDNFTGV